MSQALAEALARRYREVTAAEMLEAAVTRDLRGRVALVSSFGAESVALLALAAEVDPGLPVIFLETGMLFPETLAYQQEVAAALGLSDVRLVRPDPAEVAATDPEGRLHQSDLNQCCHLRKRAPLHRALHGFDAWITGRKRSQGGARAELGRVEAGADGRVKLNPLADWSPEAVRDLIAARGLPPHPMVARGYPSIGCAPCTTPAEAGEAARAGRWRDAEKTECGIHFEDGAWRPKRAA